MIRLRQSGVDEILIKRAREWYEPGPGVFIAPQQAMFSPAMLFTTGVNGVWYDPSDLTTLYQNAAGTTPVTAVEQPVGKMLDKSGRGNHAFNSSGNSANFPVLSARYNRLEKTEDFSNAYWVKRNTAISANATTAPDGTLTADLFYPLSSGVARDVYKASSTLACNKIRISAKAGGKSWLTIPDTSGNYVGASFNLFTGQVGTVRSGYTATIEVQPNGFYACTLTASSGVFAYYDLIVADADNSFSVTANGTDGIYIWGADLRVANDALNQPAYQRVNTATDYDTVGFKPYLSFNGVNQWLQTNSIDFTYGDKMFVAAGVRKLSDASLGAVVGLTTSIASNSGAFRMAAPGSAAANLAWSAKGTTQVDLTSTTYTAPITSIISGTTDIAGSSTIQRINGAQTASSASSLGTGNFSNAALYLGATGGASNWFNGRLYGLVVAGKQASASEIASTETWLNQKTGAY